MRLSSANFVESLERRWRLLKPSEKEPEGQFRFLCFLYVANVMSPPSSSSDFHRATENRIQQARMQRLAHEAANSVRFGAITAHHLDIVNARRPDTVGFHVPDNNTTAQAMDLDQQREDIELKQMRWRRHKQRGVWFPVEVDVVSLRRAVGLPDHKLFTAGIFHSFTPNQPTNPNMEGEEHKDNDETMSAQEDGMSSDDRVFDRSCAEGGMSI
ncbi:hypothetical protein PHMEG_00011101 [Phytophthora megakarya]|uniref:Uncharacterized protein n=1 Tax=Phytophthora megakarya TaxID=4795 RepID=A0A225WC27_9STRA|nr:hypothetical protein PHMEG_00011101 [Phytophthora megakarya]